MYALTPDAAHTAFLLELGASKKSHSGRTLLAHLEGTARLLKGWQCDSVVQTAGLFHSVYGTNAFRFQSLSFMQRVPLVELIGAHAETLVFLFCTSARPRAFLDAAYTNTLESRIDGVKRAVSPKVIQQLLEIECANLLEQGGGWRTLASVMALAQNGKMGMTDLMRNDLRSALQAKTRAKSDTVMVG